ncbi:MULTISPECIES: DUF2971 domain-containing protein [unclassified Exiguobacterium]|uniref:DUF2971 domain-containing protein n=1 Tax=unclassified Exiguobacterium TaxID=2644629 RepID=UPI0013756B05|nr:MULTISPECIES: DUF2971 domain-containing protein [unclassified Exiguobacterium]
MYRFRRVENLIGKYEELENQQIYFADLAELNDPMEGMRRYFWQGDRIVWENFFKHYLLCMEHVIFFARLSPDESKIKKGDIPIFKSEATLPTEIYRGRIKKINNQFFNNEFVQSYLDFIIKNPNRIYIEEMYIHLKILSHVAINSILEIDIEEGLISDRVNNENRMVFDLKKNWESHKVTEESYVTLKKSIETLHGIMKSQESILQHMYRESPKLQSILIEFTQMYLDSIVELTYPKAYVACFMDNCTDSSIWGTYGDNHTGVCLKFRVDNESEPYLTLKTPIGVSSNTGKVYNYVNHDLKSIDYSSDFGDLDFFKNLGTLSLGQLKEQWYTNENGELSICGKQLFANKDEWRSAYWSEYEAGFLKKLPSWAHEKEYRIIIKSSLSSFDNAEDRVLEYKFESLEAIIFGMKTSQEHRSKIIEIVVKKCKELQVEKFDFFEMTYSNTTGSLFQRKLYSVVKGQLQF